MPLLADRGKLRGMALESHVLKTRLTIPIPRWGITTLTSNISCCVQDVYLSSDTSTKRFLFFLLAFPYLRNFRTPASKAIFIPQWYNRRRGHNHLVGTNCYWHCPCGIQKWASLKFNILLFYFLFVNFTPSSPSRIIWCYHNGPISTRIFLLASVWSQLNFSWKLPWTFLSQ